MVRVYYDTRNVNSLTLRNRLESLYGQVTDYSPEVKQYRHPAGVIISVTVSGFYRNVNDNLKVELNIADMTVMGQRQVSMFEHYTKPSGWNQATAAFNRAGAGSTATQPQQPTGTQQGQNQAQNTGNTTRSNAEALGLDRVGRIVSFRGDESHWYSIDVTQNNATVIIQTVGSVDTLLYLYNNSGALITSDDDSGDGYNACISRTLSSGKYYIEVKNYDKNTNNNCVVIAEIQSQSTLRNADQYYNRAMSHYENGNYDLSIDDLNQAIRLSSNDADFYHMRALAYYQKDDYDRSIADYTQAIRLAPNNADLYLNRGNAYYQKDDYDAAIADYTQAIRRNSNDVDIYYMRARAYSDMGDYDRAIADATEAIRIRPNGYAYSYQTRGYAYMQKGNYTQARADANRALQIDPNYQMTKDLDAELKRRGY